MSDIPNKFRFCCLPVLPTIFSDELSYLDVLSKMRDSINQMIDALKQQDEDIANIQTQVDKFDPSKYIQTSGGTLTGPLFFLDQNSVVKNADGTFTVQSNNPVVLKAGQTVAVNATGGIELRSGGTVLVTGTDGVSILDKSSAGVAVYEGNTAIAGNIEINGPTTFGNVDVDMVNARTKVMNLHGDRNVTIDTPESIAIVADKHVDITGSTGVEIIASENGAVNIEGGAVAITGDINIHGTMKFNQGDTLDARGAGVLVDEPQIDDAPVNLKYFNEHKASGGVTCGYITTTVDDSKTTVDVRNENLIPNGVLGGYYVDNAGNLWHATQVVAGGFTLENQNINVLANAEFVRTTGNTSVKNINVNDTGSSAYQATTNILVHGGTDVDITAGTGTVDLEAPIVDIHAARHVNIDTGDGGSVVIGGAKSAVDMGNAVSVLVPTPLKGIEAANKAYVDNLIGPRMKMLKPITAQAPYLGIPGDDFANYTEANIFIQASPNSTANEVWIGTILLLGGSVADCHVVSIDATTGTQQLIQPDKFLITSSGMIINGLSRAEARGCYFVIPS
jgi:hypothetical protein